MQVLAPRFWNSFLCFYVCIFMFHVPPPCPSTSTEILKLVSMRCCPLFAAQCFQVEGRCQKCRSFYLLRCFLVLRRGWAAQRMEFGLFLPLISSAPERRLLQSTRGPATSRTPGGSACGPAALTCWKRWRPASPRCPPHGLHQQGSPWKWHARRTVRFPSLPWLPWSWEPLVLSVFFFTFIPAQSLSAAL